MFTSNTIDRLPRPAGGLPVIKPAFVRPGEQVTIVGRVFGAPLVVKGLSWLPLAQLAAWPIMAWVARRRRPSAAGPGAGRWRPDHAGRAGLGWLRNIAHATAARLVGKPMDAIRIMFGMPLVVYHDINAQDVTPNSIFLGPGRAAVQRLAGPVRLAAPAAAPGRSVAFDLAETALATNIFLPTVGLLPIPFIDGGPVLKWSLVARGRTVPEADQAVRRVNVVLGLLLSLLGGLGRKKRRRLAGGFSLALAGWAFIFRFGLMKEQADE